LHSAWLRLGVTRMSKVWIGTSGWTYDGWRGPFYAPDVAKTNWLCWYAGQFRTTEINGSFYRTPSLKAVEAWRDQTPKDFLFAWKASKFITHWKRLNENCPNSIELMETRLKALSPKVGAVLFQLPPQFSKNRERLASFLNMLPRCYPYAFEFRHESWYDDDIYQLLRAHDVALCISDHHDAPSPWEVTARHVYLRGHGPDGRYKNHLSGPNITHLGPSHPKMATRAPLGVRLFRQRPEERRSDRRAPIGRDIAAGRAQIAVRACRATNGEGPLVGFMPFRNRQQCQTFPRHAD
jgi:uncharacterized protein YecE (DUF72 family)